MTTKPRLPPHLFAADPDVPPDHNGRHACRCGLVGRPGDGHHTLPDMPTEDRQRLAAGEREDHDG